MLSYTAAHNENKLVYESYIAAHIDNNLHTVVKHGAKNGAQVYLYSRYPGQRLASEGFLSHRRQ